MSRAQLYFWLFSLGWLLSYPWSLIRYDEWPDLGRSVACATGLMLGRILWDVFGRIGRSPR